jgi:hypothetical protein
VRLVFDVACFTNGHVFCGGAKASAAILGHGAVATAPDNTLTAKAAAAATFTSGGL